MPKDSEVNFQNCDEAVAALSEYAVPTGFSIPSDQLKIPHIQKAADYLHDNCGYYGSMVRGEKHLFRPDIND